MRKRANVFLVIGASAALQMLLPTATLAAAADSPAPAPPTGEDRWVPSLSITGGAYFQEQRGWVDSEIFEDGSPDSVPLQGSFDGDDFAVSPFVAVGLEVMTPAFEIPTRPRLFLSAEVLPTFASERDLALDGDPDCIRGFESNAICAVLEDGSRTKPFGQEDLRGEGSVTSARVDTLAYGANFGVAFPARIGKRNLRIKPSIAWINYKVDAEGQVIDANCDPDTICTDYTSFGFKVKGFFREPDLRANSSKRFNGIGPSLDIEMDAARWGPIGAALFLGGGAYRTLGDRKIEFGASESGVDQIGEYVAVARYKVEVDPWLFRAHVGIRFQWLGKPN